jgi:type II secretory pathway pseudopilin PulG
MVLVILGLLLGSLMSPLSAQIDQKNHNSTQQQINEVREALIGFAVARGRLPRPAISATIGDESPAACGTDAACTGFIPWATLGITKTDAWNKLLRYSVTPAYADSAFSLNSIGSKKIQSRDSTGAIIYLVGSASSCDSSSPCAPAVIYSPGKNNWGTTAEGIALPDESATNADEDHNQSNSKDFFWREQSTGAPGGEFDDVVSWIPPYVLLNRMIAAGRLP